MNHKSFDAVALGEVLIDFTYNGKSASGQKLFEQNPGGAPANMLAAMNQCGLHTAFIGKVGNDMHGLFLKDTLAQAGIHTSGLILSSDYFTTLAFVGINEDGERNFSFARKPGADTMLSKEEVNIELLEDTKILHVGSLSLTHEPCKSATFFAIEKAKDFGAIISYDPNYRASLWKNEAEACEAMKSLIPYVDIMKISDEETLLITKEENIELAAKQLLNHGIAIVVVTLGSKGAYVCTHKGGAYVDGFVSEVVDTTGAGDSFWGGFLYRILGTNKALDDISLDEASDAASFGNAVASLCVEKRGGIPAIPSLEAINTRYNSRGNR